MSKKIFLGIDLGTSNTSIAQAHDDVIEQFLIDQSISADETNALASMPSTIYIEQDGSPSFGVWAKKQSKDAPNRGVLSSKSWLCHQQETGRHAHLPWGSSISEEQKLTPKTAAKLLLEKALESVNSESEKEVVVTVPASFDEEARHLTVQAAIDAGIQNPSLLEEPIAAMYSWISQDIKGWQKQVEDGDLILVCDIGGGTSDFSLVCVRDQNGQLALERISVGPHLLLGGDNMDLALAYRARMQLESEGHDLDEWQFQSLIYHASEAKEKLFSEPDLASHKIAISSRGSNLFASAITVEIPREWLSETLLAGFFPEVSSNEEVLPQDLSGLQEFGLNYEHDPAITRHLAQFLRQAAKQARSDQTLNEQVQKHLSADSEILSPSKILFNGGVFKASAIRDRLLEQVKTWGNEQIVELSGAHLDLAVSRGAAFFSQLKSEGKGLRIQTSTAKSYYLGIESGSMAIPGVKFPTKGLCIVPQGTEEGSRLRLPNKTFALRPGQEVQFKFYSSKVRAGDQLGDVIADADKDLEDKFSLKAQVEVSAESVQNFPVWLESDIDDMGMLKIRMKHTQSEQSWSLAFNTREQHD